MKKLIAIIFVSCMLGLLFSACGSGQQDEQTTYRYQTEPVYEADEDAQEFYIKFRYSDEMIYATFYQYSYEDASNDTCEIVAIDSSSGERSSQLDASRTQELGTVVDLAFDGEGELWVLSQDERYIISKIAQGEIQTQITIDFLLPNEFTSQQAFCIDPSGRFYIATFASDYQPMLYVLTAGGQLEAEIKCDGFVCDLVLLQDEVYAVYDGEVGAALGTVDLDEKKLDSSSLLAQGLGMSSVAPANIIGGQYCYYDLNGINVADSEGNSLPLLSWTDYGLSSMYPSRIFTTNAGDILCCSSKSIIKMKRVPADEGDRRQVLTLAAFSPGEALKALVADFNRTNADYMVSVIDYDLYNTDSDQYAGLNKLNTEIIGGNPPDMIDMHSIDAEQYIAKGILEDLYPYLDNDPDLNREDFLENVLTAMSDGGKLYGLTTTFRIQTILAKTAEADLSNWDLCGIKELLESNPESFIGGTKTALLELACTYMQDNFVDWETNTASFDTPEFISFLEACDTLPEETDIVEIYGLYFSDVEDRSVYAASNISNFSEVQSYENIWGTDVSLIGYPETGSTIGLRVYIGILSTSAHKETCWSFLRTALLPEAQTPAASWANGFPISKSAFETSAYEATVVDEDELAYIMNMGGDIYEYGKPTEEQVAKIADVATTIDRLASNNTVIKDIVLEEAALYFDGSKSAEKVAEVIQNRVQTYMNEQA